MLLIALVIVADPVCTIRGTSRVPQTGTCSVFVPEPITDTQYIIVIGGVKSIIGTWHTY